MDKIWFRPNWVKYWGIVALELDEDCEVIQEGSRIYIHRKGDTAPCCFLKKRWIKEYTDSGHLISVENGGEEVGS